MSAPYNSPWQRPPYPQDNPYPLQPIAAGHHDYPGYPPGTNHYSEPTPTIKVQPYDPPQFFASKQAHETIDGNQLRGRTPSPTPSEQKELNSGVVDWKAMGNWRFWFRKKWLCALL